MFLFVILSTPSKNNTICHFITNKWFFDCFLQFKFIYQLKLSFIYENNSFL
ncbi:hypothetical protein FM106_27860 [Brachybacterium faecium]|nr:hypothetical protein FM106_27860 [Brachybacterium faecium]